MHITPLLFEHLKPFIDFRKKSKMENKFLNDMSERQFIDMMNRRPSGMSFILLDGNDIVGQLFLEKQDKNIHIQLISVLKQIEGTGAGKKLLLFVEQVCAINQCNTMSLMVNIDNKHAIGFYERMGFVLSKVIKTNCKYVKILNSDNKKVFRLGW